jgi:hypothetical protein
MAEPVEQQGIWIKYPPEYEMKLLTALAYFLGREINTQALACLSMYLRQSEPRIMAQVKYYAYKLGMHEYDLLDLISENPESLAALLKQAGTVHADDDTADVFKIEDE